MINEAAAKIREGQIVRGPQFPEPMYVAKVSPWGPGACLLGLVSKQTWHYRRVILFDADIESLTVEEAEK